MRKVSRRSVLKAGGGAAIAAMAAAGGPLIRIRPARADDIAPEPPPEPLGRVTSAFLNVRQQATTQSDLTHQLLQDEVLALYDQTVGEAVMAHNPIWYRTDGGYVYSSYVQPIEDVKNAPEPERAAGQFWGEVTVPYTDSRVQPDPAAERYMRLYYTGVFRVISAATGADGQWWYRLQDGVSYGPGPYVPAADIRRIDPSELTPLSPDVVDKRVEVSLAAQTMTAYENGQAVMTCRVSSGYGDFGTPVGTHTVLFKYPTARMTGGEGEDAYDLPGVAFPTFLTWSGVAVHAAYWHNDFGRPRSHGCLNVPASVARWVWRWTAPAAPYEPASYFTPRGTSGTQFVVF